MQHLKLALLQVDIVWQNAKQNRINYSEKIQEISETVDVIVLPEMFSTGFSMQAAPNAESMQGETVKWMQKMASEKNTAICGSLIISQNNNYYNRFVFVKPSGEIEKYDKRHLFTLAGEEKVYTAGTEKLIIDYKGWKICPQVCYDLRFPVWARNVENYDVLLYVANWPKRRILAWDSLLKARAIENMCYTIGVNRVGVDASNFEYNGHTSAFDYLGAQIVETTACNEAILIVTLEKNSLDKTRNKFNFLRDKDSFNIF
ncbi:amidohydrolase [Lutibacter sp. A80]|uniref:amidohydrolase n=1 Tax=Lutibacter sp. A80 TaxID=2918453 RepID=UPI001F050996|nr:amidohydrolase [Lutibacter sp. A80]UMB59299.1 amidohydrolase [Lutibacter sp. A80]